MVEVFPAPALRRRGASPRPRASSGGPRPSDASSRLPGSRPSPRSLLERHQRRREQGIPTLTVLTGPPAAALSLWSGWLGTRGQPFVLLSEGDPREGVRDWLRVLERSRPLATLAVDFLGATTGRAPEALSSELMASTEHEREVLLQALAPTLPPGDASTACLLLLRLAPRVHRSGGAPEALLATGALDPLRALAAVQALVPGGVTPALLLSGATEVAGLTDRARFAARVFDAVPSLAVALLAPASTVDAYLRGGKETQARALVREGRLPLQRPSREDVERRLEALGLPKTRPPGGVLERLAEEGVADEVLSRYGEAAHEGAAAPRSPEAAERARSSAERFLYALLEALPDTRGLFELNARAEFRLRGRPVEVDFLSRRLRVALEVDGYHHFRGEPDYRRERRKDVALQCHGYWVLRFLATDVVSRLEEIRDTLREVLSLRREGAGGPGSP